MRMLKALIKKEFLQIRRNGFLPKLMLGFPIFIMLIIPWVTNLDVHDVEVAVVDHDRSSWSQRIVSQLEFSGFFHLAGHLTTHRQALDLLEEGKVDVIVEIPDGFENDLRGVAPQRISVSANAVNAIKASLGMQYALQSIGGAVRQLLAESGVQLPQEPVTVQYRYNPVLNYRHYMIPALMIMILILMSGFLPALSIVGEKEKGTIEQINATPVGRFTFTLSKLIPYWIIGLAILTIAMLIVRLVYGFAPAGRIGLIYLGAFLFILAISGLGVTVANKSDNMQQTMFVMFFFMIIFILMSGLLTPVTSMPDWAQRITRIFPPRYFVDLMRGVYLKGAVLSDMGRNLLPLLGFAALFNVLAALSFRKQQ